MTHRDGLVIVAGGSGQRFGGNKLLELLNGVPVFILSVINLAPEFAPDCRVAVVPAGELSLFQELARKYCPEIPIRWALGGAARQDSVLSGLHALPEDVECVAVHDAARPLAQAPLLHKVMAQARITGGAIPARPVTDTLKRTSPESMIIQETVSRENLFRVETPQCFRLSLLLQAYANTGDGTFTDEGAVMENSGYPVAIVPHETENIKLTYRSDLPYLEWLLNSSKELR